MQWLALLLTFCCLPALAETEHVTLSIGRTFEWPAPRRASVSVSNGAIIRVVDQGSRLKVTAKKLGSAAIRAGDRALEISVVPEPVFRLYDRLRGTLEGKRGLELTVSDKGFAVRGKLLRLEDWQSLATSALGSAPGFTFAAQIEPEMRERARKHFRDLLRESHLPDLSFELEPSAAITIPSAPADLKARVGQIFGPYGFRVEASAAALSLEPSVRVRIIVSEMRKNLSRQFGIQWPSAATAQLLPALAGPESLEAQIVALENRGLMKILASPTLLCRSGKSAEFLAGGEFPIKIAGHKTKEVVWKRHGVLLKIEPKADYSGRMSIGVETEVSMIDPSRVVDGVPAVLTNRISSHFDLSSSRTIALSGLIKKEWGESTSGLPGLSALPVLGALFSSRDFQENETELVVLVTPELALPEEGP